MVGCVLAGAGAFSWAARTACAPLPQHTLLSFFLSLHRFHLVHLPYSSYPSLPCPCFHVPAASLFPPPFFWPRRRPRLCLKVFRAVRSGIGVVVSMDDHGLGPPPPSCTAPDVFPLEGCGWGRE